MDQSAQAPTVGVPALSISAKPWLYLEDLPIEQDFDCGGFSLTPDEIAAYAAAFDPRPFHSKAPPEPGGVFTRQVASGLHTLALGFSVFVRCTARLNCLAGISLHETRFLRPLLPDEPVRVRARWTEARASRSRPGAGVVTFTAAVVGGDGAAVLTFGSTFLTRTRP